jgi:DNA-directed RNA polymerase specialized sigma24 family protein
MPCEVEPRLTAAEVCRRCEDETLRYRRGVAYDDRYCFEMIRRAIAERDDACWEGLQSVYGEQVRVWCRRRAADPHLDADELVALAWEKFFINFTAEKFGMAGGSATVLRYLKMCAQSAVIDALRARSVVSSLDADPSEPPDTAPAVADAEAARATTAELWRVVSAALRGDQERVLVQLMYAIGLKSAEIQAQRPDLFPAIGDVYRVTRNLHDRLARSVELRAWREAQRE